MDNMSMVAFIAKFMKLKYYVKTDDLTAVGLLKDNIHPHIHFQLFSTSWHSADYDATLISIKEIGTNLKAYHMYAHAGQEAGSSKMIHQMETTEVSPGLDLDNEIRAISWDNNKKRKGKAPALQGNKCFNCSQDRHGIRDCKKLKIQCGKCKFHSGSHQRNCLKYITKVHATSVEQASAHAAPSVSKDPFAAICSMDFKQMQAYFWDKKDLMEKSGKGKAQ